MAILWAKRTGKHFTTSLSDLQKMDRADLIEWNETVDPDGDFSDEATKAQGCKPHPTRSLLALAVSNLIESDLLDNDVPAPTIHDLARGFCSTLLEWIGPENLERVRERNRKYARKDRDANLCASHEFCDANMALHEAYRCAGMLSPVDFGPDSDEYPGAADLWNTVWSIAKAAEFDPARIAG